MDLLYDAAVAWQKLLNYRYEITCGKSKKLYHISLDFDASEFYHLVGFPHMKDITLPVRFSRSKTLMKVLDRTITQDMLVPSVSYERIVKRKLQAIVRLEELLNRCSKVYIFSPKRLPFYTDIKATYLLADDVTQVAFLFTDTSDGGETYFSRSAFVMDDKDFRTNQSKMTVLEILRTDIRTNETCICYCREGFRETSVPA